MKRLRADEETGLTHAPTAVEQQAEMLRAGVLGPFLQAAFEEIPADRLAAVAIADTFVDGARHGVAAALLIS